MTRLALCVIYYEDQKRDLLRDAVLPSVRELAPSGGLLYVQRHWRQGPQVRIVSVSEGSRSGQDRLERLIPALRAWLEQHPSRRELDVPQYVKQSYALGQLELEPPPYEPLFPNNSLQLVELDPMAERLGGSAALAFKESFLAQAMEPVLQILRQRTDPAIAAMTLLASVAATYPGGILRGHLSLRSHVEDFLFQNPRGEEIRAQFEHRYVVQKESVDGLVSSAWQGSLPHELWRDLLNWSWDTASALARAGELDMRGDYLTAWAARFGEDALKRWTFDAQRPYSEFHQALRQLNFLSEPIDAHVFAAYRLILNCAYMVLPLLDVSAKSRYYCSYAVCRAVENLSGLSWRELFSKARQQWEEGGAHGGS